jgi:DNA-binding response OmpR family regulator
MHRVGWRKMTPENPVSQKDARTSPFADPRDASSPGAHKSVILVVDDDGLFRKLITLLMQQDGYFVLSAANGHEGLELSRQYAGTIDLLITDVEMPRLNGTDLCAHVCEERPGIKVLVMSGAGLNETVGRSLPFLAKPFDPKTLKARVRVILGFPVQPSMHLRPGRLRLQP